MNVGGKHNKTALVLKSAQKLKKSETKMLPRNNKTFFKLKRQFVYCVCRDEQPIGFNIQYWLSKVMFSFYCHITLR